AATPVAHQRLIELHQPLPGRRIICLDPLQQAQRGGLALRTPVRSGWRRRPVRFIPYVGHRRLLLVGWTCLPVPPVAEEECSAHTATRPACPDAVTRFTFKY